MGRLILVKYCRMKHSQEDRYVIYMVVILHDMAQLQISKIKYK